MAMVERVMALSLRAQSQAEAVLHRSGAALEEFLSIVKDTGMKLPIFGRRTYMALLAVAEGTRQLYEAQKQLAGSLHMSEKKMAEWSTAAKMMGVDTGEVIAYLETLHGMYERFSQGLGKNLQLRMRELGLIRKNSDLLENEGDILIKVSKIWENHVKKGQEAEFWYKGMGPHLRGFENLIKMGSERLKEFNEHAKRWARTTPPELLEHYRELRLEMAKMNEVFKALGEIAGRIVYPALIIIVRVVRFWIQGFTLLMRALEHVLRPLFTAIAYLSTALAYLGFAFSALFAAINLIFFITFVGWIIKAVAWTYAWAVANTVLSATFVKLKVAILSTKIGWLIGLVAKFSAAILFAVKAVAVLLVGLLAYGLASFIFNKLAKAAEGFYNWLGKAAKQNSYLADKSKELSNQAKIFQDVQAKGFMWQIKWLLGIKQAQEDVNTEVEKELELWQRMMKDDALGGVLETIINFARKAKPPLLEVLKTQREIAKGMPKMPGVTTGTAAVAPDLSIGRAVKLQIDVNADEGYHASVVAKTLGDAGVMIGAAK